MVRNMLKTSSKKKKRFRTPGGKLKVFYIDAPKRGSPRCAMCGKKLHGVSHTGSKTQKRVSRKYPNLCPRCSRYVLSLEARGEL